MSIVHQLEKPGNWTATPLGRLTVRTQISGSPHLEPLSVFLDEGVVLRRSRPDNHNRLGSDLSRCLVVEPGDLVFNRLRTWQGGLGESRYRGIVSPAYIVCRPSSRILSRFLHYQLRSTPYLQELTRVSKWMPPAQFDIGWDQLRQILVLVPDNSQQHRICDFLDFNTAGIDALISKKQELITLLRERRTTISILACTGGLLERKQFSSSRLPWAPKLPSDWHEVLLRLVARVGTGHTPSRSHPEWWIDCTIPWVTTGDVSQMRSDELEYLTQTREKISHLGLANSSAVVHQAGTVLLSRTASPGYSAIMASEMATSQDFVTWTCGPLLRPRFLLLCLRAMRDDLLNRLALGSTHKTIYMPDISSIRIPLPPTTEQDRIVEASWSKLGVIDDAVTKLERQTMLLSERRQALITLMVTGQMPMREEAA